MNVQIFDPAMCCSTGVCGPSVDPELTRLASAVYSLSQKGYKVTRYNLANDPGAFTASHAVNQLLHEKGPDVLPVTLVDGEVAKEREYPSNEELAEWFSVSQNELTQKPKARLSINLNQL
ncbi:arsenite efflux transporter metallochaperone ArsD [Metabacillus indicus]|uniref:arsenite efflux transporter metallochaperone ArsD n=1 Tax=Metabacillus indicus TaxID=246786 RepID=UPI0024930044|nr:arsenite efflux transporter metallochaperone ArsD [Metabacillus indicus]MDX8291248.1 arsenite efflux transporter metallochaperone ArsD [Metabacillus indicus]